MTRSATGILAVVTLSWALASCGGGSGEVRPLSPDSLQAWLDARIPMVILDVRPDSLFQARRVAGAHPVGARSLSEARDLLPREESIPLVFYNQDGVRPLDHDTAGEAAGHFGFPLVYWLEGGFEAWSRAGHAVDGMWAVPDGGGSP